MRDAAIEMAFVQTFVERARRERYLQLLSKPKSRAKATFALATNGQGLLEEHVTFVANRDVNGLASTLRRLGAPANGYVISPDTKVDAATMPLEEALSTLSFGQGAILVLIPDQLALRIGEYDKERMILQRPPGVC